MYQSVDQSDQSFSSFRYYNKGNSILTDHDSVVRKGRTESIFGTGSVDKPELQWEQVNDELVIKCFGGSVVTTN